VCQPSTGAVADFDIYTLSFETEDTIPVTGVFRVTFPPGFSLDQVTAEYSDVVRPGVPGVSGVVHDYQSVLVYLDSTGTPAVPFSPLQLVLTDVYNSTQAREFSIALEILDGNQVTLFGPTLSSAFSLVPDVPVELQLLPSAPNTVGAGETLEFTAIAIDVWGNLIQTPLVSLRVEPDSLGAFNSTIFTARKTGQGRVIAELGILADTLNVSVLPGPLARWEVTGLPAGVVAGAAASTSPILVTALDAFDNRQVLYTGSLHFTTADPAATLPATSGAPFVFAPQDSGRVSFPGSGFVWRTAGADSLVAVGGGITRSTLLHVSPDAAFDFELSVPDTVTAGLGFTVAAQNVVDRFGNAASGIVTLSTSQSDSLAPNGQVPSLPPVLVDSGNGFSQVVLFRAGEYPIFGRIGDSLRNTPSIVILPAATDSFAWKTTVPLVSGLPVDSPFSLTALDPYLNPVHQYAQAGSPVTLSTTAGDSVAPALLSPADFQNGVVDLHARNFIYFGPGGSITLVAQAGAARGTSAALEVDALVAESLSVVQSVVRRGVDTLKAHVRLRLLGSGLLAVTGLELLTNRGNFPVSEATPPLPANLAGPSVVSMELRWPVPAGLTEGPLTVACRVLAQYSTGPVQAIAPDTVSVTVVTGSQPALVSLVPTTVAYDDVLYLAKVTNTGGSGISFQVDSSLLVLTGGLRRDTARTTESGVQFLGPGDTLDLEYLGRHISAFVGDSARPAWHVRGTDLGRPVSYVAQGPSRVNFTSAAALSYLTGSQTPDSLVAGVSDTLRIRIRNTGLTSVASAEALLELSGALDTIRAQVTRSITPFSVWMPGDTTLAFSLSQSQLQVDVGWYRTRLVVTGRHNRLDTSFVTPVIDSVYVVDRPSLSIDSISSNAPRRTQVSTGQTYTITAHVTNRGEDVLDTVRLALLTDGRSQFVDTVTTHQNIFLGQSRVYTWQVTADSEFNSQELFETEIVTGHGRVTRQTVTLGEPSRNFLAVQTQEASDLEVQSRLFSPADALDGRIAAGSPFEVAGRFVNLGAAPTSGARLRIVATGGVQVTGPIDTISPPLNVDAIWSLKAPEADTTALIIVRFDAPVQDLNTGDSANVSHGEDTLLVRIVFEAPPLRILNVQTQGGAVDAPYVPMSWSWANDDPTGLFPILVKSIEVEATDANGSTLPSAAALVESAQLELPSDTVAAVISGSRLIFGTDSLARVAPGAQGDVRVRIVPRLSGSLTEFKWTTRANVWSAVERSVGGAGLPVPVLDERGLSLFIESDLAFVPGSTAANYPNPFRAGSEVTHIQYDLSSAAQVDIWIYTVSGQGVWSFQAAAGSPGGRAGPNTVDWDGRNGSGNVVMDGVYVARLRTAGTEATMKIVVMK